MAIYQVSDTRCFFSNPKVGSSSFDLFFNTTDHDKISLGEAFRQKGNGTLTELVLFVKDPIKRLDSLFNMFYKLALDNSQYTQFIPEGTITADGHRVDGSGGANEHHFKGKVASDHAARLTAKRILIPNDDAKLRRSLDNEDFQNLANIALSGARNSYWASQVDLCTYKGAFVPNIIHKFDNPVDVQTSWAKYFDDPLPHENTSIQIPHDDFKLDELKGYYSKDFDLRRTISGD